MHDLARDWNTNYFTVQTALTSLVREGLVERKPRLGSFVRKQNTELKSVGIYYGDEILIKHERAFQRSLHAQLLTLLQKENISANVFIDCRPPRKPDEPLPELTEAIQSHSIQGLIVPLPRAESSWLQNLSIPTSFFSSLKTDYSRILVDNRQIMSMACDALRKRGCRTVGLINPTLKSQTGWGQPESSSILNAFYSCLESFDLVTQKSWVRIPRSQLTSQEAFGYREFHKLWSLSEKPDGLIVYPENVCRGVILAALELQVKVPDKLKIVLHKNQEVEFLCPLAVDWVITQERGNCRGADPAGQRQVRRSRTALLRDPSEVSVGG